MFNLIKEGDPIKNGFNFYSLTDESSFGVKIRYGKKIPGSNLRDKLFMIRYSRHCKKWFIIVDRSLEVK